MSIQQDYDTPTPSPPSNVKSSSSSPSSSSSSSSSSRFNFTTISLIVLVLLLSFAVGAYLGHCDRNYQDYHDTINSEIRRMKARMSHLENENQKISQAYSDLINSYYGQSHTIAQTKNQIAALERQILQQRTQNEQILALLAAKNTMGASTNGISQKEKDAIKAEFESNLKQYKESTQRVLAEIKVDLREQYRKLARVDDQTRLNFESIENLQNSYNSLVQKLTHRK